MSVIYFLVLVGALVLIHELGHFLAARLLDFKVLTFSIGFGRPLVRVRVGETAFQLGAVPLGGYVRLLGEDDDDEVGRADAHRAWRTKPAWQRALVVVAGPAANLLLPLVLYFAAFAGHRDLPAAVVGDVVAGSPAAHAGLEPGDRIVRIDGAAVRFWDDVEHVIRDRAGRPLHLSLERRGRPLEREVVPILGDGAARAMVGIVAAPFLPQVGVIDPASPAARAGLRTGDLIAAVDGEPIDSFTALDRKLAGPARRINLTYLRPQDVAGLGAVVLEPAHTSLVADTVVEPDGTRHTVHGVYPADRVLAEIDHDGPAARAGLQVGDLVVSLDGEPVDHWLPLEQKLAARGAEPFTLGVLRATPYATAMVHRIEVRQEWQPRLDDYGQATDQLILGARPRFVHGQPARVAIDGRFAYAAANSVERTVETIGVITSGMWSVLRGQSPEDELGGPITMFRVAAVSGKKGLEAFLLMLALVSVSVGLINLLPVPILDGGHLVVFAIEAVRRRPLSARARDRIAWLGFAVVGLITFLALRNDVMRYVM